MEQQVKLKICIVQSGETLDSLSERYALPVQQILRVNHLEANQDVYEGQVLYYYPRLQIVDRIKQKARGRS